LLALHVLAVFSLQFFCHQKICANSNKMLLEHFSIRVLL
jgi:hypothetical protein